MKKKEKYTTWADIFPIYGHPIWKLPGTSIKRRICDYVLSFYPEDNRTYKLMNKMAGLKKRDPFYIKERWGIFIQFSILTNKKYKSSFLRDADIYSFEKNFPKSPELETILSNLENLGADKKRLIKLFDRELFNIELELRNYIQGEKEYEELRKIITESRKRYISIKNLFEKNTGFSTTSKKLIQKEILENLEILALCWEFFKENKIKKIRNSLGWNYLNLSQFQKSKIWRRTNAELAAYINTLYHRNLNCGSACNVTHEAALKDTALLLKACFPQVWGNLELALLSNRIKQDLYKTF